MVGTAIIFFLKKRNIPIKYVLLSKPQMVNAKQMSCKAILRGKGENHADLVTRFAHIIKYVKSLKIVHLSQ